MQWFTILYSKYINSLLYSKYQVTQKMCGATYYNIREMSDMYIFININLFVLYKYKISSLVIFPNVAPHFFLGYPVYKNCWDQFENIVIFIQLCWNITTGCFFTGPPLKSIEISPTGPPQKVKDINKTYTKPLVQTVWGGGVQFIICWVYTKTLKLNFRHVIKGGGSSKKHPV